MTTVLRNRNFLFLWLAQVLSQLAQQIINFALVIQVGDLTKSSAATAIVLVCFTVPGILFSAIAGVFVDRESKRKMMIGTNIARGAVMALFIIIAILQARDVTWFVVPIVYVLTFVFSSISQFFVPAEGAMIPLLVKRNELIAANSLFNLTFTAAQLIGFALLAPILTPLLGYRVLYICLLVLYIISAVLCWMLPKDVVHHDMIAQSTGVGDRAKLAFQDLKEGWNFIRRDGPLVTAIIYWSIAIAVFFMLATIAPQFLENVLGIPRDQLSFILLPGGLGLVVGVVLVGRVSNERNRSRTILVSIVGASILLMVLVLTHDTINLVASWFRQPPPPVGWSQAIIGITAFFLGLINSFITVPAQTVLQERSPEQIRARVFSAFYTVSNIMLLVPLVLAGALADLLGVVRAVVLISALMLIASLVGSRLSGGEDTPPSVDLTPGDDAAEAFIPGTIPVAQDDEHEHTLTVGDSQSPRGNSAP